jgi:outer membrane protein assembly factor BamB
MARRASGLWGAIALMVAISLAFASGASAAAPCTAAPSSAGEWPIYGHDLANTRTQPDEHAIGPGAARKLKPAWIFKTSAVGDMTAFQSPPSIDGGCAFIGSADGNVFAVNIATGKLVWQHKLSVPQPALGGAVVGAPAVEGNKVIVIANQRSAPYAVALDRSTGSPLWQSPPVATASGDYTNASPIVANGLVAVGFSATEGADNGQGGFALLDEGTGQIVKQTPTIPPADQAQGFAGGGLWSTPAFDPSTGFLYWGAGNPSSKTKQHPNTDAILKIDLNRSHATFGEIVARYEGNVDQYSKALQFLSQTVVCSISAQLGLPYPLDDPLCGQLDLDFGSSAQLFTTSSGTKVVGDLQKSGVYHTARADTMAPVWTSIIGLSCQFCNAASTAVDGSSVYGVGTPGGVMYSLARDTGRINWQSPTLDIIHYEPTSVANGVVYTIDTAGFFDAWNARTGETLVKRQTAFDVGALTFAYPGSHGVSVGENTVLVSASSTTGGVFTTIASEPGVGSLPLPGKQGAFLIAYKPG